MTVLGENARQIAFKIAADLRSQGLTVESDLLRRSLKAQLREASRKQARWVIIVGDDEIANNQLLLKNMATSEQQTIGLPTAVAEITAALKK